MAKLYDLARDNALGETGLPDAAFPQTCPYPPDQVRSDDFWPD